MKKKIISLLLVAAISSTALISCGNTKTTESSNNQKPETEQTSPSPKDSSDKDSNIVGENNKPTVEVNKIATISDFKDKAAVEKLLGKAVSEDDTKAVYEKENYTFEVTYSDSKCKTLKIIPKSEMKFPADAANILKLVGIDANQSDKLTPAGLEWNDKFDVLKVTVASNNEPDGKIKFAEILFN